MTLDCEECNGAVLERNDRIFQATKKGNLYMYDKKSLETLKKLNVSKFELNSMTESFDSIFLCDIEGGIYQINKEEFKIENKANLQKEITKIVFD